MKRYAIAFHSYSTGTGLEYDSSDTPAEALQKAQKAKQQGLRDVKIVDTSTAEALDAKSFAAKHKL
jgi:hypothetical protein